MTVEEGGDRVRVGDDPGHVRRDREAPDLQRTARVANELLLEPLDVDAPVLVLGNHDDVGDRLPPGQLVGVVLVGPDEHDRPLRGGDPFAEPVAVVELGGQTQVEHLHHPVDRPGRAGAAEDHGMLVGAADGLPDDLARLLAKPRRLKPGTRRLGVCVRVQRQHDLADVVLDERERTARRGVVRVGDAADSERPEHRLVLSDCGHPDRLDQAGRACGSTEGVRRRACGRLAPRPDDGPLDATGRHGRFGHSRHCTIALPGEAFSSAQGPASRCGRSTLPRRWRTRRSSWRHRRPRPPPIRTPLRCASRPGSRRFSSGLTRGADTLASLITKGECGEYSAWRRGTGLRGGDDRRPIRFHDWIGDSWAVLFSHPKNFTPVCTTELGYMAKIKPEFDRRGVKVIGLSVDPVEKHAGWAKDIEETQGAAPNYPIIGDADFKVSKLYGMLGADVSRRPGRPHRGRQPDGPQRVRDRPRQEDQADPRLPDDDRPQLRRGAAGHRLAPADRKAQGLDPGELAAGRRRDHRRLGLQRAGQGDLSMAGRSPSLTSGSCRSRGERRARRGRRPAVGALDPAGRRPPPRAGPTPPLAAGPADATRIAA